MRLGFSRECGIFCCLCDWKFEYENQAGLKGEALVKAAMDKMEGKIAAHFRGTHNRLMVTREIKKAGALGEFPQHDYTGPRWGGWKKI